MKSIKCQNCGLVNFQGQTSCKRCGNILHEQNKSLDKKENVYSENALDFTQSNQKIGYQFLAFGIICCFLPWIWTFVFGMFSAKLVWASIIAGPTPVVLGIAIILSPPKSKLDAEENKFRNGILILIGLFLGLIEAYFFNKSVGLW